MADAFNTTTSHAELIPEIWTREVILAATDHTVNGFILNAVNVAEVQGGYPGEGDILHFPIQSRVNMSDITQGTAHDYVQASASEKTLTINVNKGVPLPVTSMASALALQNPFGPLAQQVGMNAALQLDTSLAGLYSSAGETVTGTTAANVTEANIREAKRKLDLAKAPLGRGIPGAETGPSRRFLIVDPIQLDALTAITAFRNSQTYNRGDMTIPEGWVGRIHSFDVYLSHNVKVTTDGFKHLVAGVLTPGNPYMSSIVWAPATHKPLLSAMRSIDTPALGLRSVFNFDSKQYSEVLSANMIYGVAAVRSEWLVDIKVTDN